jgi:hypothetical protein
MDDGVPTEIVLIGIQGIVDLSLFMGGETMTSRAVILSGGQAAQAINPWWLKINA